MIDYFDRQELKKLTSFFIPFLIFVGSLRLILFYNLIGIKIVDYLNFTEVFVSFLDTAIYYMSIIFVPIFILLSFFGKAIGKQSIIEFQKKAEMTFGQRLKTDIKEYWFLIIIYAVLFIIAIVKDTWSLQGFLQIILNPGVFVVLFVLRELRITYQKQYNHIIPVTYLNLFLFSYLFVMNVVQNVLSDIQSITKNYKYIGTTAIIGDEKITSDSTITYVGQTKDFIFFYNLKTKDNIIYPKKELKKIIIKKKEK